MSQKQRLIEVRFCKKNGNMLGNITISTNNAQTPWIMFVTDNSVSYVKLPLMYSCWKDTEFSNIINSLWEDCMLHYVQQEDEKNDTTPESADTTVNVEDTPLDSHVDDTPLDQLITTQDDLSVFTYKNSIIDITIRDNICMSNQDLTKLTYY